MAHLTNITSRISWNFILFFLYLFSCLLSICRYLLFCVTLTAWWTHFCMLSATTPLETFFQLFFIAHLQDRSSMPEGTRPQPSLLCNSPWKIRNGGIFLWNTRFIIDCKDILYLLSVVFKVKRRLPDGKTWLF